MEKKTGEEMRKKRKVLARLALQHALALLIYFADTPNDNQNVAPDLRKYKIFKLAFHQSFRPLSGS